MKKKEILLNESHLKLNEYLKNKEKWGIEEIKKRGVELAKNALNIWIYPEIDESIEEKIENEKYNSITLDELQTEYKSLKFVEMKINEQVYKIKSCRDIVTVVVDYVCLMGEVKFKNLFVDAESYTRMSKREKKFYFSTNPDNVYTGDYMNSKSSNIYIDVNRSGYYLIKVSKEILDEFEINSDDVIIKYYK